MTEARIWVINSSPMIALSRIGRLDLLLDETRLVQVPEAVAWEIRNGPKGDPARQAMEGEWASAVVPDGMDSEVMEWGLGMGESAVLSVAKQAGATAVLDDRAARIAAKILGVRAIGTLGVVLRARMADRIPSSVEMLQEMKRNGLRLGDSMIREALLRTTGERWPE